MPTLTGCVSNGNVDPWEKTNRAIYNFNDVIDRYALKPASDFYIHVIPQPIRQGLDNGFRNLEYGNVILNDFLQARWGQGLSDVGRMAVNSTIGIAGWFDVATGWGMPEHDNDLGITLARWGVKPGIYIVVPILGPTTARDAPNFVSQTLTDPVVWVGVPWYVSFPLRTTEAINYRSRAETAFRFRNYAAIDPYVFTRDAFLQYRENLIREGKVRQDQSIYDEDTETGATTAPVTAPSTVPGTAPASGPQSQPGRE
jgi:phospholipid-binding lipoprotein MlaA